MTKIVVIEDNEAVREEVADILRFEGFDVTVAANGRLGLAAVAEAKPDVILCDLMMPELDGYETLAALRADAATESIPFVFLTARAERPDTRRAMELGADDYLVKPFATEDLLRALAAALERRAGSRRASEAKLTAFARNLSSTLPHELRTPLTAILGHAEILTETEVAHDPEQVVRTAKRILEAGLRLNRLTENFLLHAQLEADASGVGPGVAVGDLDALVARAARARAQAYDRAGDLALDVTAVHTVLSARFAEKIVDELVDNAFKFSLRGDRVAVELRGDDREARLVVEDRGRGMTPAEVAAIGAYVQFERNRYEHQGVGLGLAMARRIAAMVGGRLDVQSTVDVGTTVTVTLPQVPAERGAAGDEA